MTTEELTVLIASAGIVGAVLNPVISFLKIALGLDGSTETKRRLKTILALGTSLLGGGLVAGVSNKIVYGNLTDVLLTTGLIFAASTAIYNLYWKDSTPEAKVEGVAKKSFR